MFIRGMTGGALFHVVAVKTRCLVGLEACGEASLHARGAPTPIDDRLIWPARVKPLKDDAAYLRVIR